MSKNKSSTVWERPKPFKPKPNLLTETARKAQPFVASYENNPEINIKWLLSNEYHRIWFEEKKAVDSVAAMAESVAESESFARKVVNRRLSYLKKKENANAYANRFSKRTQTAPTIPKRSPAEAIRSRGLKTK